MMTGILIALLATTTAMPLTATTASLHEVWGLSPAVADDVLWIAEQTGADPFVLAVRVRHESSGRRGAVRWADKHSCYNDCDDDAEIWLQRTEVGLFQLRDHPQGTSWVRKWNKAHPKDRVTARDMLKQKPHRKVVAFAIEWMMRHCDKDCKRCDGWLACWNGCRACRGTLKEAAEDKRRWQESVMRQLATSW